ncbi:hypothetical protein NDU88_006174 [Pleurodeles waltl]|uniref:Uncharacterized protein n=1 Tax=Pleurodeles waltl TaxID=8319 RepID=A0AAV7VQM7_PLEWA|nr:hypothetical protein NDU88_006174 [Pleurodeles waltl]
MLLTSSIRDRIGAQEGKRLSCRGEDAMNGEDANEDWKRYKLRKIPRQKKIVRMKQLRTAEKPRSPEQRPGIQGKPPTEATTLEAGPGYRQVCLGVY